MSSLQEGIEYDEGEVNDLIAYLKLKLASNYTGMANDILNKNIRTEVGKFSNTLN